MTGGHDERPERDEFADWPRGHVEPLPPPPGTYERVRRQARHRRLAKALGVGAAAAVVVAGGVFVPRMINAGRPQTVEPAATHTTAQRGATPRPSSSPDQSSEAPPPSSRPTHTHPGHHPATRSSGRTATPGSARCHTDDLAVHLTGSDAGAGQRYAGVVLTNTSSRPCTMYGYIGIGLTGRNGPMPSNLIRDGGPIDHIRLSPGASAATSLHWAAIPGSGEDRGCPRPTAVAVTPPNETTQLSSDWQYGEVCQHGELHTVPLIAGSGPPPF